jgi:hypothetical protein
MKTVTMDCRINGRFVGMFQIDEKRAYEYEARSPWNDGRGDTVWTFGHPHNREACRSIWRASHPQDTI